MKAGLPVMVQKVTGGHLKSSSKVISKYKGGLTKKLWPSLCLVSLERLSGSDGIGHQRLFKVTNQVHLKR